MNNSIFAIFFWKNSAKYLIVENILKFVMMFDEKHNIIHSLKKA